GEVSGEGGGRLRIARVHFADQRRRERRVRPVRRDVHRGVQGAAAGGERPDAGDGSLDGGEQRLAFRVGCGVLRGWDGRCCLAGNFFGQWRRCGGGRRILRRLGLLLRRITL